MSSTSFPAALLSCIAMPRPTRTSAACYVGIDIGVDKVRVATFRQYRDPAALSLGATSMAWTNQWEFALPIDAFAAPPSDLVEVVVEALADKLPRCVDGEVNDAVISLPIPWVHYETASKHDLDSVQSQCDTMFRGSLFQSDAHLRSWPIASGASHWCVAAAAEAAAVEVAQTIDSLGYRVQGILPHGVALVHAASPLTSLEPAAVALLELSGGLVALRDRHVCGLCRHLPAVDDPVSSPLCIDEIEPWISEVGQEINATLRYAARYGAELDPDAPLLIGGSMAQVKGVDQMLASTLRRPVATWRYAGRSRPNEAMDLSQSGDVVGTQDAAFSVALSLACCGTTTSADRNGEAA